MISMKLVARVSTCSNSSHQGRSWEDPQSRERELPVWPSSPNRQPPTWENQGISTRTATASARHPHTAQNSSIHSTFNYRQDRVGLRLTWGSSLSNSVNSKAAADLLMQILHTSSLAGGHSASTNIKAGATFGGRRDEYWSSIPRECPFGNP